MRIPVVVAYARSDADGELLKPHVKPGLVIHDRGDEDAGARIIRSLTNPSVIVIVVKIDDIPAVIAAEIRDRGGQIMTLDAFLASGIKVASPGKITPSPILFGYARSEAEHGILSEHVRPGLIMMDRGQDADTRFLRGFIRHDVVVLCVDLEAMPDALFDDIVARGGGVITLEELLAAGVERGNNKVQPLQPTFGSSGVEREEIEQNEGWNGENNPIHPRLPDVRRDAIRADVAAGKNITQTAKAHGISRTAVRNILREI
ncbi:MAG: hypothetical protein LCH39_07975 [Proteobacteria bacterium]|nr:hypothetical protein [Pseudomonadota bacterium]